MLLNLYLTSTAISWGTYFLGYNNLKKRIKSEGYTMIKSDKSLLEKINTYSIGFIPVLNVFLATDLLFNKDYYINEMFYDLKRDNKLRKIENIKMENPIQKQKEQEPLNKDMTRKEKIAYLEEQKQLLLKEKESKTTSDNSKSLQKKKIK